jgi:hypothetical protein
LIVNVKAKTHLMLYRLVAKAFEQHNDSSILLQLTLSAGAAFEAPSGAFQVLILICALHGLKNQTRLIPNIHSMHAKFSSLKHEL